MKNIIIIPAYKPGKELLDIVEDLEQYFEYIIVVNDGSGKEYDSIFEMLKEKATVLNHYTNLGKGRALKTAFNEAMHLISTHLQIEWGGVITVDADGQHLKKDIIAVSEALDEDLVLGCRNFNGKEIPLRSRFGNNVTKAVFKWLCGIPVSDTQTGLRGIPAKYLEACCKIEGERYEYETNVLLKTKTEKIKIKEIQIETIYENDNNSSHFRPIQDSWLIYRLIFSTFIKYCFASLSSFALDMILFYLLIHVLENQPSAVKIYLSTILARIASSLWNYSINRKVVFRNNTSVRSTILKYYSLCLVQMLCSAGLVLLVNTSLSISETVSKAIVDVILFFLSFQIQNRYIF